ncbi:MAG TPA: MMPL family transporter, partial [Intrasporangium sp.]|nr:MMPL family transporter [Intrasporangium sp.]
MAEYLFRLGQAASRHAPRVIAAWFAVLLAAGIAFAVGAGTLTSTVSIPGTRTAQVTERLERVLPQASGGSGSIVFETSDGSRLTEAQRSAISERAAEASRLADVATVVDPFQTEQDRAARQQELDKGGARIEDGRRQLAEGRAQLDDGQAKLDAAREQAKANGTLDQVAPAFDAEQANLDAGRRALEDQATQLEAGSEQIDQGARLLELSQGIGMVSQDGTTAIVTVLFDKPQMDVTQDQKDAVIAAFGPVDGVEVSYSAELASGIPTILGVGEVIGIVVAAVVLIVMLGTLIGAGLPLLTALVGVAIGALFTLSLSSAIEMTSVTPVLGLMLGLAVGIDYSLFIINRHRRQLKQGYGIDESIGVANGTSGNAVVFAGATVLIALLALNVTGIPFLGLMGTVGALSIAIAVLIAVTLTPALLGLIGERILSRRERARLAA